MFAGLFERKHADHSPMFLLATIAPKEVAMKGDPIGIECVARFFDEPEIASKPGFKAAWIGFLRAYNVFQFLPRSFFATSRGLEANAYATLTDITTRSRDHQPANVNPELGELLDLTAPEARSLLRLIGSEGLPLPEPGYELAGGAGEVIATAELAWPGIKLALLLESETNAESAFSKANWTTHLMAAVQSNPQDYLARLLEPSNHGGENAN